MVGRAMQRAKAPSPILVTELGMMMEVREEQAQYLQVFYYQLFTY